MKRGFPRPQVHIPKTQTHRTTRDDGTFEWGSYGKQWDNRTYPLPYTAEEDSISSLHSGRLEECIEQDCCIACGEPVDDETVSVLYNGGLINSESGPFHEKCARLTAKMCPHIAMGGSTWEFKRELWAEVKPDVLACLS